MEVFAVDETIQLTDVNRELLRRVLLHGMDGSYYDRDETPGGKDIDGYLRKETTTISASRVEAIADFYSLSGTDLLEIIADERECGDWLARRAYPWDDPW